MARGTKYVTVRTDHYLAMLALLGGGVMYAVLDFKLFMWASIASVAYIAFTIVRDWRDLWVVFQQEEVELKHPDSGDTLEPTRPKEGK